MRVAIVADSHFDSAPGGRLSECIRVHQFIADDIAERGVDLVLHSGDVYERKSTPEERIEAARFFQACAAVAPVVVVRGNHDAIGDLMLLERLQAKHPITVVEGAFVVRAAGADVACLAWPTQSSIVALAESQQHGAMVAADALRAVLRGLGQQLAATDDAQRPRILLTHAMVRGSRTSHGQPLVGCDMELGLEDLALTKADFYALGHIHMPQDWVCGGDPLAPAVYPGSPRRTAFGEVEKKGYVVAEFDGRCCVGWDRVPTPCAPMLLLDAEWTGDDFKHADIVPDVDRAEVRLRYSVDADQREAATAAAEAFKAELLECGAVSVKLEAEVRTTTRARAPEVAAAHTLADKLDALWRATDQVPDDARRARLLARIAELESAP